MGIQDIIENGEQDLPVCDSFDDEINDEDDFPVIYSDTSSDTASISEAIDDYMPSLGGDDDNLIEDLNWLNESNDFLDESINYINDSQSDMDMLVIINLDAPQQPHAPGVDVNDVDKLQSNFLKKFKNISAKSKNNLGKRKARRYENARQLDLLIGNADTDDCGIDDLMPFNCTFRFSQILEDSDLTNKILNPSINANDEDSIPRKTTHKRKNSSSQKDKKITASAAFNNLDSSEKTFFKRRNLPMGMVHYLDSCVFSFFQNDPTGTYVSEPLSSYERMMLHGIAHYYRLNSISYNTEPHDIRLTKVTNSSMDFNPPGTCLSQYLEEELRNVASGKVNHSEKRGRFRRPQYVKSC